MLQAVTSPSTLLIFKYQKFQTCTHTDDCGFWVRRFGVEQRRTGLHGKLHCGRKQTQGQDQKCSQRLSADRQHNTGQVGVSLSSACLQTAPGRYTWTKQRRSCKHHMCNTQVRWHTRGKDRLPAQKGQQPFGLHSTLHHSPQLSVSRPQGPAYAAAPLIHSLARSPFAHVHNLHWHPAAQYPAPSNHTRG
jgi:hypothetical protein